jgi:hypothetical protein
MTALHPEDLQPEASPPEAPSSEPVAEDPFLSGAYRRILRTTIALSVAATIAAMLISWQSGLGLAAGSFIACLSFVWLHQGAEILVRRMLPGSGIPSKFWLLLSFPARYFVVIAAAYVILKSYPGMRVGFIVGLVLPVLAMMCEAAYEAFSNRSHSPKI